MLSFSRNDSHIKRKRAIVFDTMTPSTIVKEVKHKRETPPSSTLPQTELGLQLRRIHKPAPDVPKEKESERKRRLNCEIDLEAGKRIQNAGLSSVDHYFSGFISERINFLLNITSKDGNPLTNEDIKTTVLKETDARITELKKICSFLEKNGLGSLERQFKLVKKEDIDTLRAAAEKRGERPTELNLMIQIIRNSLEPTLI